jgi:ABC-type nitrate/sulfonate/bicarbonate transport system substrate-binding protein
MISASDNITKVRVGGVPEHFNLAWHQAIESGAFAEAGFDIEWQDVPGGTGAMCKLLRNGDLDLAIGLTEGIVADIIQGNQSKILQFYVNSPLHWGIFVHASSSIQSVSDMPGKQYAISRYKSGSHLMAYVNARNHGFQLSHEDFVTVGDLEGARKALKEDTAQLFLWEKFTTKPFVDAGEFRMIGECVTPWPCFVIAATSQFIDKNENAIAELLNIINLDCWLLMNNAQAPDLVAARYGIKIEDARQWFKELEYSCAPEIEPESFKKILINLKSMNIIQEIPEIDTICYHPHILNHNFAPL